MCDVCKEIETTLTRYRRIMARFDDAETIRGITGLIDEAEAEKLALHPAKIEAARATMQ